MKKNKLKQYRNKGRKITKRKIFIGILILCIISFIIGILYMLFLNKSGKHIVVDTLKNYFGSLDKLSYKHELFINLKNNIFLAVIMWFFGISLFGVIFELLYLIVKSFTLGFSLCSLIYTFKLKGIYIGLIYLIPSIINLCIYIILGFFAFNFSIYLFKYLFKNKDYNLRLLLKKYLKLLLVSVILLIISSLIETFLIPNILKLFTKTLI